MGDTILVKSRWKEAKGSHSGDFFKALDESVDVDIPADLSLEDSEVLGGNKNQ